QLSGTILQSNLGPTHQVQLVSDDTEPFQTFVPMPFCLQDPRLGQNPLTLRTSDVLPADATSCIVEGHQIVSGTLANPSVDFTFFVYTSYDGLRAASSRVCPSLY